MEKMYVLLRKDLDPVYRMVQGTHAVAEFILRHPDCAAEWNNGYLIFTETNNQSSLSDWCYRLTVANIDHEQFYEPDLGHELTAVAFLATEEIGKKLRLHRPIA